MSKKEIVIADVVNKYDNPIAELVQVASFPAHCIWCVEIIASMQKVLWGSWLSTRTTVWKLKLRLKAQMKQML